LENILSFHFSSRSGCFRAAFRPPTRFLRERGLSLAVLLIALGLPPFGLTPQTVAQQDKDSIQTKIIALEKAWNQAFKYRDKKALAEILDESMILANDDGSLQSRSAFMAGVDGAPTSDDQQAKPESMSVRVYGDVAVVTGIFITKGVDKGKPYVKQIRFVDTWMNKGGSWVCIAASATPVQH
jgi:ketosteroid isomerase-like protein